MEAIQKETLNAILTGNRGGDVPPSELEAKVEEEDISEEKEEKKEVEEDAEEGQDIDAIMRKLNELKTENPTESLLENCKKMNADLLKENAELKQQVTS